MQYVFTLYSAMSIAGEQTAELRQQRRIGHKQARDLSVLFAISTALLIGVPELCVDRFPA